MEWAGQEGVCLIPFGGGTSVTRALEVPPLEVEPRPVVSVDMRKVLFFRLLCSVFVSVDCRPSVISGKMNSVALIFIFHG